MALHHGLCQPRRERSAVADGRVVPNTYASPKSGQAPCATRPYRPTRPDPTRLRYRDALDAMVRDVVRGTVVQATSWINALAQMHMRSRTQILAHSLSEPWRPCSASTRRRRRARVFGRASTRPGARTSTLRSVDPRDRGGWPRCQCPSEIPHPLQVPDEFQASIENAPRHSLDGQHFRSATCRPRSHIAFDQPHSGSEESWFEPRRGNTLRNNDLRQPRGCRFSFHRRHCSLRRVPNGFRVPA